MPERFSQELLFKRFLEIVLRFEAIPTVNRFISKIMIFLNVRSEVENIEGEKEILLRKLVEVEMDGRAAAEEVGKLRDTIRRLKNVSCISRIKTSLARTCVSFLNQYDRLSYVISYCEVSLVDIFVPEMAYNRAYTWKLLYATCYIGLPAENRMIF